MTTMGTRLRLGMAMTAAVALAGCAGANDRPKSASAKDTSPDAVAARRYARDPYPSTYRAYPGVPTLVRNVTIFDGEGARIDNGQALFADGKIVAVGQSVEAPAGVTVIDGQGKYLTPRGHRHP